jgi:hypothetical protein
MTAVVRLLGKWRVFGGEERWERMEEEKGRCRLRRNRARRY